MNYLEKERKKKVLHTEESIEHGTVAINYLEKILEKKKKQQDTTYRGRASNTVPLTPTARVCPPSYRWQRRHLPFFKRSYTPYF